MNVPHSGFGQGDSGDTGQPNRILQALESSVSFGC